MAVPSDLTATLIVTEAYDKSGIGSPTSAQITRGEAYFLREIINEIWMEPDRSGDARLKTLQQISVQIGISGQSKYAFPSDFDTEIGIDILSGGHTGTATAGAATTITLAADEDAAESEVEGKYILLTSGTGSTGLRQCKDYNATTKVATVDSAWETNPDATTGYLIVSQSVEMEMDNIKDTGNLGGNDFSKGKPNEYVKVNEGGSEYFVFDRPLDSAYGILLRYYVDPNRVDLTNALMTKIYNNWQNILTIGTARKIVEDEDDGKYEIFERQFSKSLKNLIARELPAGDEFMGFE